MATVLHTGLKHYTLPIVLGGFTALLLGLAGFRDLGTLGLGRLLLGGMLLTIGGVLYWIYIDWLRQRPFHLLIMTLVLPATTSWLNFMLQHMGINMSETMGMAFLIGVPGLFVVRRGFRQALRRVTHLRWFAAFVLVVGLYYVFYNHHVLDARSQAGVLTLGFHFLYNMGFHLLTMLITATVAYSARHIQPYWQTCNRMFLGIVFLAGITTLITYPVGWMITEVDGINRAQFIFMHPNQFAHFIAIYLVYLAGMLFYQLYTNTPGRQRMILGGILLLGYMGLFLSFSKTALFGCTLSMALIAGINLLSWKTLKRCAFWILILAIAIIAGVYTYQHLSGTTVLADLTARMEENNSLIWRYQTWEYLSDDAMSWSTLLMGHGLSATAERSSQFQGFIEDPFLPGGYAQILNPHNGYIGNFYDFGLLGYLPFGGLLVVVIERIKRIIQTPPQLPSRALDIQVIALILYFLVTCGFDTTFDIQELPFWIVLTLVYAYNDRMRPAWTRKPDLSTV